MAPPAAKYGTGSVIKNTEIGNGATALHAAVENGHLEAAKILLESGAVQSDSMEGATPLIISLQYQHPQIALILLHGNYPDPIKMQKCQLMVVWPYLLQVAMDIQKLSKDYSNLRQILIFQIDKELMHYHMHH